MSRIIIILIATIGVIITAQGQKIIYPEDIKTGAEKTELYYPLIKDKRTAVVSNHTSMVGEMHLVDTLVSMEFKVVKVFSPEHGFRGTAGAGDTIDSETDIKTGLQVISLYGTHKKPTAEDLAGVDVVLFDIQDVGIRVYTYISTMTYIMEACAENDIPVIILDRPNPNGHYIDGPLLDTSFRSFVGLHPVPLVHGMTIGEYARMVNGEGWLGDAIKCDLEVIPVENYAHKMLYQLPVKPSPNLPNMNAVYLYPSLVLFEGTMVSIGRGTDHPFEVIGHPDFLIGSFVFTPESKPSAQSPKHEGKHCYGTGLINLTGHAGIPDSICLHWLLGYYDFFKDRDDFFISYFNTLAGSNQLKTLIINGKSEAEIKASWQEGLGKFEKIREKYLLYEDF